MFVSNRIKTSFYSAQQRHYHLRINVTHVTKPNEAIAVWIARFRHSQPYTISQTRFGL